MRPRSEGPLAVTQFEMLRERYGCCFIEVHCTAPAEIVQRRFRERWASGERHPGHSDGAEIDDTLLQQVIAEHVPLALGGSLIEVDTTDLEQVDLEGIVVKIGEELHGA